MTTTEKVDWEIEVKEAEHPKELPKAVPIDEPMEIPTTTAK